MTEPAGSTSAGSGGSRSGSDTSSRLRSVGWGIGFVVAGVLWLLVALDVEIPWDLLLPVAIIVIGVVVILLGRRASGDGLIGLGITLAFVALIVSFAPGSLTLTAGDRHHHVTDAGDLDTRRSLGAGSLTVDLREVELPAGATEVSAGVTFGELIVRVPSDVELAGTARAAMGEVVILGDSRSGLAPQADLPGADRVGAARADAPVLDLDLTVGFGRLEVRR